ncbi:hypothetical protein Hanom_Chr07g00625271 [Helianthus anomalus]
MSSRIGALVVLGTDTFKLGLLLGQLLLNVVEFLLQALATPFFSLLVGFKLGFLLIKHGLGLFKLSNTF